MRDLGIKLPKTAVTYFSNTGTNGKVIRNVLRETLARILRMKVQRVISYAQRVEQDIESVIYGRGIYAGWHCQRGTECNVHIVFGQRDLKNLRLDTAQLLNRDAINCHREVDRPINEGGR
jgi:hypothetical protein